LLRKRSERVVSEALTFADVNVNNSVRPSARK
jgi:hypothetical protein